MTKMPELIAPAGNWAALTSAVSAGADAVYFGVKGMNMRAAAGNFDLLELRKVMDFLHGEGRKGYLALNILIYNHETGRVARILEEAAACGVDAVIGWDMAVLTAARERGLELHLSTQAGVSNIDAVRAYCALGVKRIVLARECTLKAIKEIIRDIRAEGLDCSVETFVHGAMCVSVSGRCFLSQYSFGRSANRGECLQPCRREFGITDTDNETSYVMGEDYLLSPKDLCSVGFLDKLIKAGIGAFKIEGRMRPPEYVRVVTSVYRDAMDAFRAGTFTDELKEEFTEKLGRVFNRGFDEGFYFSRPAGLGGEPEKLYEKVYLGEVVRFYGKIGVAEIILNCGSLRTGQDILVSGSKTPANFAKVTEMQVEHRPVAFAEKGGAVGVKLPFPVRVKDKVFLWKTRRAE